MRQKSIRIFLIIFTFIILAPCLSGCAYSVTTAKSDSGYGPFYPDRVVTVRFVMTEENWAFLKEHAGEKPYVQTDMWYDGKLIPDIALRPKGNTSLYDAINRGSLKIGLKADLNFFNAERNLEGVKKLNFSNGRDDPSFLREVLSYMLYQQMGVPTPRTAFVDVFINDIHLGLYTMVDQIDKNFLARYFAKTNGNLYKPEMPAGYLNWTESDIDNTLDTNNNNASEINLGGGRLNDILKVLGKDVAEVSKNVESTPPLNIGQNASVNYLDLMGMQTNNNRPNHAALFNLLDILNNEPSETFVEKIEKVLDVDEVLRYLAVSAVLKNQDSYIGFGHNYYLYEVDGKFSIIPWDITTTFLGCISAHLLTTSVSFLIDEPTDGPFAERPLVARLLAVPEYLEIYHNYIKALIDGPLSIELMNNRINELVDMIYPYVISDDLKFYTNGEFLYDTNANFTTINNDQTIDITWRYWDLKNFIVKRIKSVQRQLSGKAPSTNFGFGNVCYYFDPEVNN
jgi:spore coat protein H